MDVRSMMERTQALDMFWRREIQKFIDLKPSNMVGDKDVVSLQDGLQAQRSGVSQLDMGDLWKSWADGYKELVKLGSETTRDNSRDEILQIYGITEPLEPKPHKKVGSE